MTDSADIKTSQVTERPTLRTIADLTGLAVTTVSRALNDAPDIGRATKDKVRRVASEVGYRPNRAGVRLRTGKTNVISLVLSTEQHMVNHTAQLVYSISDTLRSTAYHMIVTPYARGDDPMEPIRYIVETGSADGVIINQVQPNDPRVRYMIEQGFPFATHGRTEAGMEHPYFDFDNAAFGSLALQELVARGRKHIGLIAPPREQNYSTHMVNGMLQAAQVEGVAAEVIEGVTSDAGFHEIEAAMTRVMRSGDAPDGIISASTAATMSAVAAVEASGFAVGRDVDLVGKEAIPFLEYFRKEIIVVREDVRQAGTFLARAVMQRIRDASAPPLQGMETPKVVQNR